MISPSGKWKTSPVNNEETDIMSSRKKLDFKHTPFTTSDFQKVAYSTPSLKKCIVLFLLLVIFYLNIFNLLYPFYLRFFDH